MNETKQETTHTPGPWEVMRHGAGETDDMTIREDKTGGQYVALVQVFEDPDFAPRARANARLIAAAPTMLEALERLADACAVCDGFLLVSFAVDEARAAIAAARGEAVPNA